MTLFFHVNVVDLVFIPMNAAPARAAATERPGSLDD